MPNISVISVLLAVALCTPLTGRANQPKTAEEILTRHLAAIGGRDQLAAVRSIRITGKVTLASGQEGKFTWERKRPFMSRIEAQWPEGGTTVQGFDGAAGWLIMPMFVEKGPVALPPETTALLKEEADIDGPLVDPTRKGVKIELLGREAVGDRPTYKLRLTRVGAAEGDVEYYYLDAKSYLPVKCEGRRTVMGMTQEFGRLFEEYKPVDGLPIAHVVREWEGPPGSPQSVRVIDKVELNVAVPDERFRMPAPEPAEAAAEEEPAPVIENDPAARALYDQMVATMRAADALTYESAYELKISGMPSTRCSYKMWLKKPNHFRMEAFRADGKCTGILIGDGDQLWIHWPAGRPRFSSGDPAEYERTSTKVYMTKPTPPGRHSISHEAGLLGNGIIMTILDLSTFHGYTDSLQPHLDAVARRGTDEVDGEPCDVIEVSIMQGQRTWKIWLSQRDHLPRKLLETVRVSNTITAEETWTNVQLDGDIPAGHFVWKPPADWKEWQLPTPESQLLKRGTPAPDFELKLTDGATTKLSDYRGNVVVLTFWRVGCPPCRLEILELQKLHTKYADKGLVVLGFNSADRKNIALDLLREHSLTVPSILDSSMAAVMTTTRYRANAVPTTYIIDRDGKIADAWVGYEKDDPRVAAGLKKLAIE
jgi:peroxiredoxin/outer membrane lipoprotein-sorting protein